MPPWLSSDSGSCLVLASGVDGSLGRSPGSILSVGWCQDAACTMSRFCFTLPEKTSPDLSWLQAANTSNPPSGSWICYPTR